MASNLTVAMATVGSGPLKRVDTGATVGADGTTTRIVAIHATATVSGMIEIIGEQQITNKTAEGTAIKFQVAANEATDIYMGELGVPVYGVVSVSGPTDGCVLTAFVG